MPVKRKEKQYRELKHTTSGQTILEVLIALVLIILFLSGIVIVELYAIRNVEYAKNKSMATILARQQLERARVMRDSAGLTILYQNCYEVKCYIDDQLTPAPVPLAPTGIYSQSLTLQLDRSCPTPAVLSTPPPQSYKATAIVSWARDVAITPPPEVATSSCITDWR